MSDAPAAVAVSFACTHADDWEGLHDVLAPDVVIHPSGVAPDAAHVPAR